VKRINWGLVESIEISLPPGVLSAKFMLSGLGNFSLKNETLYQEDIKIAQIDELEKLEVCLNSFPKLIKVNYV